jgi:hypothetical protein
MRLCILLRSAKITAIGNNQNISFLPAIVCTSTSMHGEFLRLLFLQVHRETEAHLTATGMSSTQPIGLVPFQASCILPVDEEQSRTRGGQAVALRINLNVEGCGIAAAPVHAPSRAPLLLPLLLSHILPLPRVH